MDVDSTKDDAIASAVQCPILLLSWLLSWLLSSAVSSSSAAPHREGLFLFLFFFSFFPAKNGNFSLFGKVIVKRQKKKREEEERERREREKGPGRAPLRRR